LKITRVLTAFDTHSSGMTSRIVLSGFPEIPGETMLEKTKYCQENLDHLRRAIMLRPRGFKGILGAILTSPTVEEADFGDFKAIIPELSAQAYITGIQQFVIEEDDPIKYGFEMG